uniref:Uncharacterized protein n=1 Tax=Timema genevievae TaxID=629358 RepID=A0A7R9K6L3_TIMGE|nr:unnamed protein product [Timema genevievae]
MLDKTVSVLWMWSFSARFKYQLYKMEYARGLLSKYGWTEGSNVIHIYIY